MANPDHVNVMKTGPSKWNSWRDANPTIEPDLSDARFEGNELYEANKESYDLHGVNCKDTMFLGVFLNNANFKKANLINTYFTNSYLENADFRYVRDLEEADFSGAKIEGLLVCGDVNVEDLFKRSEGKPKICKC